MRISILSLLVASTLLFTNCKKDGDAPGAPEQPTTPKDFLPSTAGSTFNYRLTDSTGSVDYMLTATGRDTTLNTRSYKVYRINDTINRYLGNSSGDYYRFNNLPLLGVYEELYLKENAGINESWIKTFPPVTIPGIGFPIKAKLTYKIAEKGISKTFEGKTYTDVTRVRMDINVNDFFDIGGRDTYYAKGVGLIKDTTNVNASFIGITYVSSETLMNYNIK